MKELFPSPTPSPLSEPFQTQPADSHRTAAGHGRLCALRSFDVMRIDFMKEVNDGATTSL
ncbi:MAG: hypothetical protein IKJ35_06525 [Clostridia bacterium]|nr:hypothetical protein [Clostridia bacterium]